VRFRDRRRTVVARAAAAVLVLTLGAAPASAWAADQMYELEVVINGVSTSKVAEFIMRDGALLARADELADLGLRVPPGAQRTSDGLVVLGSLPGVTSRLEEPTQMLFLAVPAEGFLPSVLRAERAPGGVPLESGTGVTLNYDLASQVYTGRASGSGLFELRVFTPHGVAWTDALAYAGSTPSLPGHEQVIRLDSTYLYSDYTGQRRYWLGDFITGGLTWTRPVRLGGAQVTHDFAMRPDLVTFPVPSLSGSTAVPSTVDVFVNGGRVLSQQIQPGPFQVPQAPVVVGAGTVQMTVTNALGQQVTTTLPFYASASLLAPGLTTYSVEAGAVRRDWGLVSNDYGAFAGAITYRRGLSNRLTIEAHGEGTRDQVMASGGVVANAFDWAVINLGAAASLAAGHSGAEVSVGIERVSHRFSFGASGVFATSDFRDIAAMNGDPAPIRQIGANASVYFGKWGSVGVAYAQVDRKPLTAQVGVPPASVPPTTSPPPSVVPNTGSGLPFLPPQNARLLSANYSVQVGRAFIYLTGFHDFTSTRASGATIGVTIPLGRRSSASAGANWSQGSRAYAQLQAQQSAVTIGDWGYQLYAADGQADHQFAQVQYKSPWALVTAGVDHLAGTTTPRLDLQGALSFADGRVFATNQIIDSFAVVDTNGVPGVRVLYENREVGRTDSGGRLLAPDLRSYDVNHLAIDAGDIPIDAQTPFAARDIRPPTKSGVVVKFPIRRTNGALIVLVDELGKPLPLGSMATLAATGVAYTVGYDGEAFIEDLGAQNQLSVQLPDDGRCTVAFAYAPRPGEIPKLGPLTCRKDGG
jgi:outer membrane usher protein